MAYSGWFFYLYIALIFISSILLILLFMPLTLRIKLHNLREDNTIFLWAGFMLFRTHKVFTLCKIWQVESKHRAAEGIYHQLLKISRKFNPRQRRSYGNIFLNRLCKAVYWHEFTVILRAGTGDPAITGLMFGLLQILGALIAIYLRQYHCFRKNVPQFFLYPSFTDNEFKYFISIEFTTGLARLFKNMLYPSQN